MTTINTYLTFNGNCREAFEFYRSVFGGEFSFISTFGDMPSQEGYKMSETDNDKIMHVTLPISKETALMGSDTSEHYEKATVGDNFSISIHTDTKEEADRLYAGLSKNGKQSMPMENTFWNSYFGMLTDQFGINWMVSVDIGK
ncbi:VOC family protein [Lunatibacter salilacus]|uniref:VOC family protein n=1 Tax=Lunatibacter salilacus TaxID=2483804 RepID=UPI00131AA414|nr:VOC family protein [Lunatibacter salilacus]